jgi:hypothetical protein
MRRVRSRSFERCKPKRRLAVPLRAQRRPASEGTDHS